MGFKFNPFTGTFDQVGSGGGGLTIGDAVSGGTASHNLFVDESGNLANTLSATNTGILFDGVTNPYTGEFFDISNAIFTRDIGDNDGNPVSPTVLAAILTNPYSPSGSQLISNIGILSQVTASGASNDGNEYNWGVRTVVERTGTISGGSLIEFQTVGLSTVVAASQDYQNASLDVNEINIGHDITVSATTPLGTFAGLAKNSYGTKIAVYEAAGAFTFAYGVYISDVSGPDVGNCRAIYSVPDVASYHRGDIGINTETYSGQLSQVIDTSTRTGYFLQGAVGQSGNYITVVNSASGSVFSVSSAGNVSASSFTGSMIMTDNVGASFGSGTDARIEFDTSEGNDTLKLGLVCNSANSSGYFLLCESADINTNFGVAAVVDPHLRLQSADATQTSDYIEFWHDQTDANIGVGNGNLKINKAVDLTQISAGSANLIITATSDTPTVTWGAAAGNEASAAPAGYIEITVGGNARYIPFWS